MSADQRIPAVFRHRPTTAPADDGVIDPLRYCVATTVAMIAWALTPAATVAIMSGLALRAYARARRAGLLASRCVLGDTRIVLAYLAVAFLAGTGVTVLTVTRVLGP